MDECLLYRKINFLEDTIIQDDLVKLQQWEDKWLKCFNPDKCEVLRVTAKKKTLMSDYNIRGTILSVVSAAKYLGVSIDSQSFNHHIDNVAKKANSIRAFISRTTKLYLLQVRAETYTTYVYVRPLLEYSSSVWNPHTQWNIKKLGAVQRRAARAVLKDYDRTSSVTSMLQQLKWNTLLERRTKARATLFYKIINALEAVPSQPYLVPIIHDTRGHAVKYYIPTTRTVVYQVRTI